MTSSLSTREQLIQAASSLFYRFGYQAVGVDQIADDAGVAKMTLYRHFPSKDDLIAEHLQRSTDEFWKWFDEASSQPTDPKDKLLSLFEALASECRSATCLGCTFQSAVSEFPDRRHAANRIAREHKQAVRVRFEELVKEVGIREYVAVANQLVLLMEGAWAGTRTLSLPNPAREVPSAVRSILESQLRTEARTR